MFSLKYFNTQAENCTSCNLGCPREGKVVFGEGNQNARFMFIGEAPGYHESTQGRPLVGPAGQVLNKLLEKLNIARDSCYLCSESIIFNYLRKEGLLKDE